MATGGHAVWEGFNLGGLVTADGSFQLSDVFCFSAKVAKHALMF